MPLASLLLPSLPECNGAILAEPPLHTRTWHRRLCCSSCSQRDPWYTLTLWEGSGVAARGGERAGGRDGWVAWHAHNTFADGSGRAAGRAAGIHNAYEDSPVRRTMPPVCTPAWNLFQEVIVVTAGSGDGQIALQTAIQKCLGCREGCREWETALGVRPFMPRRRCPLCLNLQILSTSKRVSGGFIMPQAMPEADVCGPGRAWRRGMSAPNGPCTSRPHPHACTPLHTAVLSKHVLRGSL